MWSHASLCHLWGQQGWKSTPRHLIMRSFSDISCGVLVLVTGYCIYFSDILGEWMNIKLIHDDVSKWKHFPRYWPFVRGIHRSLVNSPHKGQWRGALMFSLICAWPNGWSNHRDAGDLRRHPAHCAVTVMCLQHWSRIFCSYVQWQCNGSTGRSVKLSLGF